MYKKSIKECPVPLDISIKSNGKHHKQFYILNLTKTWLGDFLGDFSLSLGDFLTETSGPPGHRYLDIFRKMSICDPLRSASLWQF